MDDFGLPPLFEPLAPCPHAGRCPMLNRRTTAWCHVNAPAEHAPAALRELSARAGLDKDSISLSFLLLRKLREEDMEHFSDEQPQPKGRPLSARIVSDAFVVPGYPGRARYACSPPRSRPHTRLVAPAARRALRSLAHARKGHEVSGNHPFSGAAPSFRQKRARTGTILERAARPSPPCA